MLRFLRPRASFDVKSKFPVEIFTHVFTFCPQHELLTLLVVSRAFHDEVIRTLYDSVSLPHHLNMIKFFELVTEKNYLASLVHTLSFGLNNSTIPTSSVSFMEIISKGLHSLINLRELNLRRVSWGTTYHSHAWILRRHPFKLRVFRNTLFDLQPVLPFLREQTRITVWTQGESQTCELGSEGYEMLPDLTRLDCESWMLPELTKVPPRHITGLTIRIADAEQQHERSVIDEIGIYYQSLVELAITRQVGERSYALAEFIKILGAKMLVKLERLTIFELEDGNPPSTVADISLALSTLPALKTLVLSSARSAVKTSLYWSLIGNVSTRTLVVERLMEACPTLTRVGLQRHARISKIQSEDNQEGLDWFSRGKVVFAGDHVVFEETSLSTPGSGGVGAWIKGLRGNFAL